MVVKLLEFFPCLSLKCTIYNGQELYTIYVRNTYYMCPFSDARYARTHMYVRTYMQRYKKRHRQALRYTEIYRNTQRYTEIYRNTQRYTEIYRNTQRYTEIYRNTPGCT